MEHFENEWKKILDGDAASSFVPDTAHIWGRVGAAQKKKRKPGVLITHAAAALAGIAIMLPFLLWHQKNGKTVEVVKTHYVPQAVHDTVQQTIIVKNEPQKQGVNKWHTAGPGTPLKPAVKAPRQTPTEQGLAKDDRVQPPSPVSNTIDDEHTVATIQPVKPIHLEDIQNNRSEMSRTNVVEKMVAYKFSQLTYTKAPSPISIFKTHK